MREKNKTKTQIKSKVRLHGAKLWIFPFVVNTHQGLLPKFET